ncbi:MAG: hypothetical protein KJO46_08800 [Gammaproteobacteria bacterium]|nr:hypothetical protein [Gammaproteobacteria bacterium]
MTPRHQLIGLIAILAIAGAVDFVKRVHVSRQPATRALDDGQQGRLAAPMPLAKARERLQSWFPAPAAGTQDPTAVLQAGPNNTAMPIPDRAEIGGSQFVLRGVFDAGPPFAVFDVVSGGGAVEQYRLSVGEEIKGVRVEQIVGRRVSLSDGESIVELALFIEADQGATAIGKPR